MKNGWVKRIATAVTTLALAASVFTGLGNSAKAANGTSDDHFRYYNLTSGTITVDEAAHTVYFDNVTVADGIDPDVWAAGYTFVFSGTNNINRMAPDFGGGNTVTIVCEEGATLTATQLYEPDMWPAGRNTDVEFTAVEGEIYYQAEYSYSGPSNNNKKDDASSNSSSSDSSTHKHHTHNWEWTALVNATENQDGTYAMKCTRCNKVDESTITVIAKESVTSDKNLQILGSVKPGETIKLDTKGTAAFNQYFIAELMKHSDSPLEVDFEYKNEKWTLTAPAGFNWPATLDDKGWAGFLRVAGENEEVTAVKR